MAIFQVRMPKSHCRHGAKEGQCLLQDCEHWNQIPEGDVRNVFGRQSSGQLAQELYKRSHTSECTPETPCEYHRQKKLAQDNHIISF
jgi:hypothetical protein